MRGLPLLAGEAERVGVGRRPPGVGDVDVDRAERGLDAVEQARDRIEVLGVEHEALAADPLGGGVDRLAGARRDGHARALGGQRGGDPEADPLRAAGDERDAPVEPQVHHTTSGPCTRAARHAAETFIARMMALACPAGA